MPREFAAQLVASEAVSRGPAAKDAPAFRICHKLRGPLAKLIGVTGFFSLMSRALALAGAEIPWLRELRIKVDGSLEGVSEIEAKLGARAVAEGEVALLGHLLGLLVIFIGPTLTLGLLHDIWPSWKIENTEVQAL